MTPRNMTQGDRVRDTVLKAVRVREKGGWGGALPGVEKEGEEPKTVKLLSSHPELSSATEPWPEKKIPLSS